MANILLVDDYQPYRESLTGKLEGKGHRVVQAQNPEKAREAFAREAFDLIILDNNLKVRPDGNDGIELAKEFKAAKPDVPLIMITGDKTPEVERLFAEAGGAACLSPMEKGFIYYTIDQLVGGIDEGGRDANGSPRKR